MFTILFVRIILLKLLVGRFGVLKSVILHKHYYYYYYYYY